MRSTEGESWTRWVHEVRRAEFEGMLRAIPLTADAAVLELGCGDGFQLHLLRERFAKVFAIDPSHAPEAESCFTFAFAEALPFPDKAFDLVVSNCVLEHLGNRSLGVKEAVRVLRPGGYMAHVVPSRFWKLASLLLNPVGYPLRLAEKFWATRQLGSPLPRPNGPNPPPRPTLATVLARWLRPPIHGTYPSHFSELRCYGRRQWAEVFRHPQLAQVSDYPLICSTQFGFLRFRFIAAREWLGHRGLDSSRVFIMRKSG